MSNASNSKIWAKINQLAPKLHLTASEYKHRLAELGAKRSNGSIANLSSVEAAAVLELIADDERTLGVEPKVQSPKSKVNNIMVKGTEEYRLMNKIRYYCHGLGWEVEGKVDYKHLADWIDAYGKHKKKVMSMNKQDLLDTLNQLENVYKTTLKKA